MICGRDRGAWLAAHVLPHEPALRAWIERRGGRDAATDEIIHETYAVLAGLDAVDDVASPRALAFQTAHAVMAQRARTGDSGPDPAAQVVEPGPAPPAASRLLLHRVRDLIAELPPIRREVFRLRKLEGLSQREVALRMAIPEAMVEDQMARALGFLMSALKAHGPHRRRAAGRAEDRPLHSGSAIV